MQNSYLSSLQSHTNVYHLFDGMAQAPNLFLLLSSKKTFSICRMLWISICSCLELSELSDIWYTLVFGRWVVLAMKRSVCVTTMRNESSFMGFPALAESLALTGLSGLLVLTWYIVPIRSWFFLGVSQNNARNRFACPLTKSTSLRAKRARDIRLKYIRVICRWVFKPSIFAKRIVLWRMSPSWSRLVPSWVLLGHGYMGVVDLYWGIDSLVLGVEAVGTG